MFILCNKNPKKLLKIGYLTDQKTIRNSKKNRNDCYLRQPRKTDITVGPPAKGIWYNNNFHYFWVRKLMNFMIIT